MRLIGGPALVATVLIAASCSSTDAAVAYLDDVSAITRLLTDESSAAIPPGATPTHESVSAVVDARRRALAALEGLDPPDDLDPEHLALVTVMADFIASATAFLDETASLGQEEFAAALAASTHIDVLAARVADACNAMRGRARTLGHAVALEC